MTKIIRSKFKIYRRYGVDLWGNFLCNYKRNKRKKIYKFLLEKYKRFLRMKSRFKLLRYESKLNRKRVSFSKFGGTKETRRFGKKRRRRTFRGRLLVMSKKLKYFYGNLLHYQIKRIFLATKIQNSRCEDSFFFNLERRLEVIFYRMGFFKSIWNVRQFVKQGVVQVNNKVVRSHTYQCNIFDCVSVLPEMRKLFKRRFLRVLKGHLFTMPWPSYLDFDVRTLSMTLLNVSSVSNIVYPFKIKMAYRQSLVSLYRRI